MRALPAPLLVATLLIPMSCAAPPPPAAEPPPAPAPAPAPAPFPDAWFWDVGGSRERQRPMVGVAPPPLFLTGWIGVPVTLDGLRRERKVVVVDFWATWCGPCVQALPKLAALANAHPDELTVIGVHDAKRGAERMAEVAGRAGALYPLAIDDAGQSEKAWQVSFWPTIAVIDRAGTLRAIGLKPEHVAEAVERVLAEK